MGIVTAEEISARLATRLFGGPLIENSSRGQYVEAMVETVLEPHWNFCGKDWGSADFESRCGRFKIEVKQFGGSANLDPERNRLWRIVFHTKSQRPIGERQ